MEKCWGWVQESHRQEAALQSGGATADTSVSFARWQQGEQTVGGVAVVLASSWFCADISSFYQIGDVW